MNEKSFFDKLLRILRRKEQEIIDFLQLLVKTPSVSGDEEQIQGIIKDRLNRLGLQIDYWEPKTEDLIAHPASKESHPKEEGYKNRPNVVGIFKGTGGGRSIILNGHSDVVSPGDVRRWKFDPWSGHIEDGFLYGRGSVDMKGGLTAQIMALESIVEADLRLKGDIILQSVIDEEIEGNGTVACIVKGYTADAAIVAEPTNLQIHPAHTGTLHMKITVYGKPAHGGYTYEGISALEKAIELRNELLNFEKQRLISLRHPLFENEYPIPPCTMNFLLKAGTSISIVPEEAILEARIGYLPNENPENIKEVLEKVVKVTAMKDSWMKSHLPKVEWLGCWGSAETNISHPIVKTLKRAYEKTTGKPAIMGGSPWFTDMHYLVHYSNIPSVLFGPGNQKEAHTVNERIAVKDVIQATKVIAVAISLWCKQSKTNVK